jgi:hypothetical protein
VDRKVTDARKAVIRIPVAPQGGMQFLDSLLPAVPKAGRRPLKIHELRSDRTPNATILQEVEALGDIAGQRLLLGLVFGAGTSDQDTADTSSKL